MRRKRKVVWIGGEPITPLSTKEHRKLDARIKKKYERLRRRYPEVHGKVVDHIRHCIEDGTLYFTVRFKDKTEFGLRYACNMFLVGAELEDMKTGDYEMIRQYMKPIPR